MKKFLFAIILLFRIFSDSRLFKSLLTSLRSKLDSEVDEQLYSRQIFVYGKSSQQRLLQSHIVIYGSGLLAAEILKNLAMAGVGKISIIESNNEYFGSQSSILQGNNGDLVKYGKSLNSQIQVRYSRNKFSNHSFYSFVIILGQPITLN
jgi:tRNA A37 threonylcarbamoyladenosine dehydratase